MAYEDYPSICSGRALLCMNKVLSDIGSHTHVKDLDGVKKECYSPCTDQVIPSEARLRSSNGGFSPVLNLGIMAKGGYCS